MLDVEYDTTRGKPQEISAINPDNATSGRKDGATQ
jgi:hypothetical protein